MKLKKHAYWRIKVRVSTNSRVAFKQTAATSLQSMRKLTIDDAAVNDHDLRGYNY